MRLYGRDWTRRELEARVGRLEQLGGVRRLQLTDGPEAGVEQIQVRTGAGLSYYVSPQRGLDLALAEFAGAPLSWQAAGGDVHPAYYDPQGAGFLRTAAGGLLMTCGLTQVGRPCEDAGESLGRHGRAHHLPARQGSATGVWVGDEYEICVRGVIEETRLFGAHLRLMRELRSRLGVNAIRLTDVVENAGFQPAPHMLLYHFNFGFPLLSEETTFEFPSRRVLNRDGGGTAGYQTWAPPQPGLAEQVFYHEDLVLERGWTAATLRNPRFPCGGQPRPLSVRLHWATENLPRLVEWKMPGAGLHVLGVEPANCYTEGRAAERQRGTLRMLAPGETLKYELRFEVNSD